MEIALVTGDITRRNVQAVVNAANSSLLGGGGVDGAIHRAAGPELLEACRKLREETYPGGLPVGEAVATEGFGLPARWVIHTVGPNARAGQTDPELLRAAFANSLQTAVSLGASSVAFPAISAGVYGWDARDVAEIGLRTVREHPGNGIETVEFVLFSDPVAQVFRTVLADLDSRD
ncbi:O-acetyl-ADP-ribose deacetylase [Arthrobacter sp. zg-Y916]|uniref:O-acetyl-ADP-ribose deacetylase n=1 Tax=Arthrobacter caoxuetaonis TaxID=2886935 RepID=A0A9X1MCC6_9MICC|nr:MULTISPECIES: O-acetyl-ADP-ribose deacetylase [Arthrobacter]MCC3297353.1 O-acetyl-ADP-ribose deacetylase [Arthrobacter caoxuetaonis]MCC9194243.1 O-acetyl-ADP-ribose deacetylase [Arthrobacter sp. zg-Y916]USQ58107.1 O-acetyl-ADP-ribose deacetylase [Arthrobacter caoxuetaonis]